MTFPVSDIPVHLKGAYVLFNYAHYPIPEIEVDPQTGKKKVVYHQTANLLSNKGKALLADLQKNPRYAPEAFDPLKLDLNLFIDPLMHDKINWKFYATSSYIVPISRGCLHDCCHCACSAEGPITHLPYPIVLKLFETRLFATPHTYDAVITPHYDSDIVSFPYKDSIIGATYVDLFKYLKRHHRNVKMFLSTKGVTSKESRDLFKEAIHLDNNIIRMSIICLQDDRHPENRYALDLNRIARTLDIARKAGYKDQIEIDFLTAFVPPVFSKAPATGAERRQRIKITKKLYHQIVPTLKSLYPKLNFRFSFMVRVGRYHEYLSRRFPEEQIPYGHHGHAIHVNPEFADLFPRTNGDLIATYATEPLPGKLIEHNMGNFYAKHATGPVKPDHQQHINKLFFECFNNARPIL